MRVYLDYAHTNEKWWSHLCSCTWLIGHWGPISRVRIRFCSTEIIVEYHCQAYYKLQRKREINMNACWGYKYKIFRHNLVPLFHKLEQVG
jgi:hypothetical protein